MLIFRDLQDAYLKRLCTDKVPGLRKGDLNSAGVRSESSKAVVADTVGQLTERPSCTAEESLFPGQT